MLQRSISYDTSYRKFLIDMIEDTSCYLVTEAGRLLGASGSGDYLPTQNNSMFLNEIV